LVDLFQLTDFLDAAAAEAIRGEMHRAAGSPASLLAAEAGTGAGKVLPAVRKTTRVPLPDETRARVLKLLVAARPALEEHFGLALGECEEPQFLRYGPGDYFVPHQDGNTPMLYDSSRFRRISAVVFLSRQSDEPAEGAYGGGSLVFHGPPSQHALRVPVAPPPGTLVAFRAETTHEVTPVTHGERCTVVSWYHTAEG
jgi:SM-20-related protein